jgi:hypothetical protein
MPPMHTQTKPAIATKTGLIVRVLQDVLRTQAPFTSYADLAETLKKQCARFKIAYDSRLIHDALDRVEHGGRNPVILTRPDLNATPRQRTDVSPMSRDEARQWLTRLGWPP